MEKDIKILEEKGFKVDTKSKIIYYEFKEVPLLKSLSNLLENHGFKIQLGLFSKEDL